MSTNFKVGDVVERTTDECDGIYPGDVCRIIAIKSDVLNVERISDKQLGTSLSTSKFIISKKNQSNMGNLKEKFVQIFLSEPEKSFRKAGITNSDGILTEEGQEVFLTWVLKKYGPEFKTDVVDKLLEEEKE